MKNRLKQLEQRVLGEIMGWHARRPFPLSEWIAEPRNLLANLTRIDAACAALLEERRKRKAAKQSMNRDSS